MVYNHQPAPLILPVLPFPSSSLAHSHNPLTSQPGYTQTGPLFHSKTRALEKLLIKSLAPLNLAPTLIYPTAPNRLRPRDIPGYQAKEDEDSDSELDSWAWWRRDEASGAYRFLKEGMMRVAETIKENVGEGGTIDGVVGFSQGGALAAMLAAAMERGREVPGGEEGEWAQAVRDANGGEPLKFSVIYSGFYAPPEELKWLYEPKIATPTLHFLGGLDTVVDESRSQGLVDRCVEPTVYTHPGGHHVPVSKEWAMPLVAFIRKCVEEKEEGKSAL